MNRNNNFKMTIPLLPDTYPSLTNALVVPCGMSIDTLFNRLSDCLNRNEIECKYENDDVELEVKNRIACWRNPPPGSTKQPSLKFSIQLWERRRRKCPNEIIVEIQRCRGCSIAMQRIRCMIHRAVILGEESQSIADPEPTITSIQKTVVPSSEMRNVESVQPLPQQHLKRNKKQRRLNIFTTKNVPFGMHDLMILDGTSHFVPKEIYVSSKASGDISSQNERQTKTKGSD